MYTGKYRIIQHSDVLFGVQELRMVPRDSWKPWVKRRWVEEWEDSAIYIEKSDSGMLYPCPRRFPSPDEAQKWIDDKRKYPIVVKEPA